MPGVGKGRLLPRDPIPAHVLVVPLDRSREPFWARTENLGDGGVFVPSATTLAAGEGALLKILAGGPPLWVRAEVVHSLEGMGFGCRFVDAPGENLPDLSRLITAATPKPQLARRDPARGRRRQRTIALTSDAH